MRRLLIKGREVIEDKSYEFPFMFSFVLFCDVDLVLGIGVIDKKIDFKKIERYVMPYRSAWLFILDTYNPSTRILARNNRSLRVR